MDQLTDYFLLKRVLQNYAKLGFKPLSGNNEKANSFRTHLKQVEAEARKQPETFSLFLYSGEAVKSKTLPRLMDIWCDALELSLCVLKWFDLRENPFRTVQLTPPNIADITAYYRNAARFESVLYASDPWYRDHFAHVLRVWLLGLHVIFKNATLAPHPPPVTGKQEIDSKLFEKAELYAMFTIAALTHDLGYPLEKMAKLNSIVAEILESFGGVDWEQLKLSFSQPRHQIAQELLKVISSKPRFRASDTHHELTEGDLVGHIKNVTDYYQTHGKENRYIEKACEEYKFEAIFRCQWKYHQKFSTSLEKNDHGLLSALLLQRKLVYFKEGEFAIEEDYNFNLEEVRQFLIRRDILRAIATHTCADVYLMNTLGLESILFFCDEIQEWGRPSFLNLYSLKFDHESIQVFLEEYNEQAVKWKVVAKNCRIDSLAFWLLAEGKTLYARFRTAPDTGFRSLKMLEWKLVSLLGSKKFTGVFTVEQGEPGSRQEKMDFVIQCRGSRKSILHLVADLYRGKSADSVRTDLINEINKLC